jgi:curved DNA-binding protein CbpA
MKPTTDPYRTLGILRGADAEQIKAAHRRLAKLFHPDGSTGDRRRFLDVQEAYQLLSDPLRRREWDRRHAPGPVRAGDGRRRADSSRRPSGGQRRGGDQAPPPSRPAPEGGTPPRPTARPGRGSGTRTRTWTAERVPWWEDFRPGSAADPVSPSEPPAGADDGHEFDVFDRSSGAAWSSAARRHFRRGTDDLPSRGVWRYRGTQVVTGAEARKVAAEEEKEDQAG